MKQSVKTSPSTEVRAGIDVGASELVIAILRGGVPESPCTVPNTPAGHRALLKLLTRRGAAARVCLEAIRRVLTDRGSTYRSKLFAATCRELGLKHSFTRPYRPQTNGKAERFIQTITREWAYARSYDSGDHRAFCLTPFLHDYNFHRPHSALNSLSPSSRLPKTADNVSRYNR